MGTQNPGLGLGLFGVERRSRRSLVRSRNLVGCSSLDRGSVVLVRHEMGR